MIWNTVDEDQENNVRHTITLKYVNVAHKNFFLTKLNYITTQNESNLLSLVYDISTRSNDPTETLFIYEDKNSKIKSMLIKHDDETRIYLFKNGSYHITSPMNNPNQNTSSSKSLPKSFTAATFNVYNFYGKEWKMGSNDTKNRKYKEQMNCIKNVNADILALQEAAFFGGYSTSYVKISDFVSDLEKMGYKVFINHYDSKRLSNVLAIKKYMNPTLVLQPQSMMGTNIAKITDSKNNEIYIASVHLNVKQQIAKQDLVNITSLVTPYDNVIMLGDFNNEKQDLINFGMPTRFKSYSSKRNTGLKRRKTIDHVWFTGNIIPTNLRGEKDNHTHTFVGIKNCNSSDHLGVRQAFLF
tara:strand:+ start:90 stop:1154 length:1065 start_codon:yes stop_codon:yes gene_type:complete